MTFLAVRWLRIRLPMQGTWVPSLVREDTACLRATEPACTATESMYGNDQSPIFLNEENHHRRTACPATQSGPNWLELEKIPYTATKTQGS